MPAFGRVGGTGCVGVGREAGRGERGTADNPPAYPVQGMCGAVVRVPRVGDSGPVVQGLGGWLVGVRGVQLISGEHTGNPSPAPHYPVQGTCGAVVPVLGVGDMRTVGVGREAGGGERGTADNPPPCIPSTRDVRCSGTGAEGWGFGACCTGVGQEGRPCGVMYMLSLGSFSRCHP